jgi:hypothetical protein
VLENSVYADVHLTSDDIDGVYRLLRGCDVCVAAMFVLLPEPESDTPPAPTAGHALNMDFFSTDTPRLEGNNCVVIAIEQRLGVMFHASIKRKTVEGVKEIIMRIVSSLSIHDHKLDDTALDDDEASLQAMERRLGARFVLPNCTPAGLRHKLLKRAIQALKWKMRAARADLDYQLPTHIAGESLTAVITASIAIHITMTGARTAPYTSIAGKRPHMRKSKLDQEDMCECLSQDSYDERGKWRIYLDDTSNVSGQIRVYFTGGGFVYSERSFALVRTQISSSVLEE